MKQNSIKIVLRQALYAAGLSGLGALSVSAAAAENNPALKALFDQAAYWHEKAHDDLATGALQKILAVDENNVDALYLMALYAMQRGDAAAAARWRARLTAASPGDPRLQSLDSASVMQSVPPAQLESVRKMASQGNAEGALSGYRALFNGDKPIDNLANEYYLVMAGSPARRGEAIAGLQQRLAQNPNDASTQLALAKVLTYQEATRREGIGQLAALAAGNNNAEADRALKQALLWLAPQPQDEAAYQAYRQRHPTDSQVWEHYQKGVGDSAKGMGFNALNSGDLTVAKNQFANVLASNPNDGDALAGMGFIALRGGDFGAAEDYLNQAVKQGGANSAQWASLAQDARFYAELDKAKQAASAGRLDEALQLSAPLVQASGDKGAAANLFRADVLRRQGNASAAEQVYRSELTRDAQDNDAKLGLYYLLRQQNKNQEAQQLLQTIPASLHPKAAPAAVDVEPLRREAALALQAKDPQRALNLLQQALAKQPSNVWVRLDMARIMQQQGDTAQAQSTIATLSQPGASNAGLYAAALFASEDNRWATTSSLLARIPAASQTREMRELAAHAEFNQKMASAEQYLQQGNTGAAAELLRPLVQSPPASPADLGNLARNLQASGDSATAVRLVQQNMRQGVKGNIGDYAAQIGVLNQAGLTGEAEAWLNNPAIQASSSAIDIDRQRTGFVIKQAAQLSDNGQYAAAYDRLIVALHNDPQNTDLMMAMARLYQAGKMNEEAGQVYSYLLQRNGQNKEAREGAINVALAKGDVAGAKQLLAGMSGPRTPESLLLAARVAEADGDHQQAQALLRSAKGRLIGLQGADSVGGATIGGLQLADNPFINKSTRTQRGSPSAYGAILPWQSTQGLTAGGTVAANNLSPAANSTLQQIDTLLDKVQDDESTWVQGNINIRDRSGEEGLSQLTEAKSPMTLSGVPFDGSRVSFTATPISLNAGTSSGTSNNRFGTGALQQAQLVEAATKASAQAAETSTAAWQQAELTYNQLKASQDAICAISSTSAECLAAQGAATEAYAAKQLAQSQVTTAKTFSPNDFNADSAGAQKANGVEVSLALSGDSYKADIGTTPLGQDADSLVGGLQWSPKIGDYTRLRATVERRSVTDSLLSYVGATDKISGKKWGAVTKNGGSLNLSYDDGDAGVYAEAGYYSYQGDNVASNNGLNSSVGMYIRPYRYDDRELKAGVNVSYINFSKNLSYFSYGQGGYFSPQDYVSVSFPIEYRQNYNDWSYTLSGAAGYQSYSQDRSAYFPNNPELQSQLEQLVQQGYGKEAFYAAKSESGVGYNFRADGNYKLNQNMLIGGQVGYDTFGSYSESTALIYFRYLLDGK